MRVLFTNLLLVLALTLSAQAKLVINGGIIYLNDGASLVIDNPDNTAISRIAGGYIISEGANNRVSWTIGAGNGADYLVPFGNLNGYLPLSFSAVDGSTDGHMIFSTYPTASWKNSDELPPGVTNINSAGGDNSAKLIDRFWRIEPQDYLTKPTLNNLSLSYSELEYAPPNTILEASLIAQRWNNTTLRWSDYLPLSVVNTTAHSISISSIPGLQLYDWWALVDGSSPLPVTLVNFKATIENRQVLTSWQTVFESKTSHFEVWRAKDLTRFEKLGSVPAAGNSTVQLNYSLTDISPYTGISYYRLKSVDIDGNFTWSSTVKVLISEDVFVSVYPNPASGIMSLHASSEIARESPIASIYDAKGSFVSSFRITNTTQPVNISSLAAGVYRIYFTYKGIKQSLSFIKK